MGERTEVRRADDFLKALLRAQAWREADEMAGVVAAWREAVGEAHARHSRVVDLQGETLFVEVDHPARVQLLQLERQRILQQMADLGGVPIVAVRYRVARGEASKNASRRATVPSESNDELPVEEVVEALRRLQEKLGGSRGQD